LCFPIELEAVLCVANVLKWPSFKLGTTVEIYLLLLEGLKP